MTLNLESTLAGTAIAAFIGLHGPNKLFAKSADLGRVAVNGMTSVENLHDLARFINELPVLPQSAY